MKNILKASPILLIIAFFIILSFNSYYRNEIESKPNIIYILADDLGYGEVGVYGQTKIETPNIDALAKDGMMFTQHYSGAPVCAPARAVLLTGKHLGHSFIRGNDEWAQRGQVWNYKAVANDWTLEGQRPMPTDTKMFSSELQKAGYKTGMFGKWGLGAPNTESIPTKMGFDYFFGYNCQRQAHTYNPLHLYENEARYPLQNDTVPPGTGLTPGVDSLDEDAYAKYNQTDYAETVSFDKMMNFVERNKSEPFFLYWASPIPHVPLQAPKNWVDYYRAKFGEEPPYSFYEGERGSYFPNRYPHATYAAMISYLDENIGKLVKYLKSEGLYDNTLIMFTSDNGPTYTGGSDSPWFESGGPFSSVYGRGKGFLYEGGIRVPFIASWPKKIKAGSKSDHISAFYDVFPTLQEITSNNIESGLDGISFYSEMIGKPDQKRHEYLYWEYPEYGGQTAIRKGDFKVLWKDMKKGNEEVEVYNLAEDIAEKQNIASLHPELVSEFYQIMCKEHKTPETERFIIEAIEEKCTSN
jgi:arylsulfatase